MPVTTRESKWPLLIGVAPLAGVAIFVWAIAQGEIDVAHWPALRAALAGVAAIGAAVAWWAARQLGPDGGMTVARAARLALGGRLAGSVTMRGRARALPEAVPLVSPDGELCVWYEHRADGQPGCTSVRPFLFVDGRGGQCVVLAAAAEVTGRSHGVVDLLAPPDPGVRERVLRAGDRVSVTGRFVAASPQSLALQGEAIALAARSESLPGVLQPGEPPRDLRAAAQSGAAFAAAPARLPDALALPVLAAPAAQQSVQVCIGPEEGDGTVYGMLALADCLVLVVVTSLALRSLL